MSKPDAPRLHRPIPRYLRRLIDEAGLSQVAAAKLVGVDPRTMRRYLSGEHDAPYAVQFCLESLAKNGE